VIRAVAVMILGLSVLSTGQPVYAQEAVPQSFEVTSNERVKVPFGGEAEVEITVIRSTDSSTNPTSRRRRSGAWISSM